MEIREAFRRRFGKRVCPGEGTMVEVHVSRLYVDSTTNQMVVWLEERGGTRALPIWIGHAEANAIALELRNEKFVRPLAHDLIETVLGKLDARVTQVVISELRPGAKGLRTYCAELFLRAGRKIVKIDARPSDSIVLALKAKAPLFVAEKVMDQQAQEMTEEGDRGSDLRERLQGIDPKDFGTFNL